MSRKRRPTGSGRGAVAESSRAAPAAALPVQGIPRWLRRACLLSPIVALAALAWSLRGAPLGAPVADDFEFIRRVVFRPQSGFLDSMGATWYWRPLSRQAWFGLVTPLLLAAPGVVAAIHVAILGAIAFVLARIARLAVPWPAAVLVGAAAIACEPARALITWPSGIQHLLAALGLALTAHEGLAGRRWTAALAAAAAALSHEIGALAFVVLAVAGWRRGAGRAAWLTAALAAVLAAGYAIGYGAALARGVRLPQGGAAITAGAWLEAARLALRASFNAESPGAPYGAPAGIAMAALLGVSLILLARSSRRDELRRAAPLLGVPLALASLGLVPLASLLPDWNSWRAFVPVLALVFVTTLACARAHPGLGLAVVALRLATLAWAEPAAGVTGNPPPAVSDMSFARLARMQAVVAGSGSIVREAQLPPGARVAYLGLPEMTMSGFRRDAAVQVWARDTSLRFVAFDGHALQDTMGLVLAYDTRAGRRPVFALTRDAIRYWRLAAEAADVDQLPESRDYSLRALASQWPESPSLSAKVLQDLALLEVARGRYDAADSLNREAAVVRGPTPDGFAIAALIELARGDLTLARRHLAACLRLAPRNDLGLAVLERMRASADTSGVPPPSAR